MAVYVIEKHAIPEASFEFGKKNDLDSGIPYGNKALSTPAPKGELRHKVEHQRKPIHEPVVVRVFRAAEDPGEIAVGQAYSPVIYAPMRLRLKQGLLFIFTTHVFAGSIFRALEEAGLVAGRPYEFDLTRIDNDPEKADVFNAWARGTGKVSNMAFFGHDVHHEMAGEMLTSIKVHFVDGTVANINRAGRITIYDGEATDEDLVALFDRIQPILSLR